MTTKILERLSFGNFTLGTSRKNRRSEHRPITSDLGNSPSAEDDQRFNEAERFAIGSLDRIRADRLRRTLSANYEASCRERESADRVHASTRLDASEHLELSRTNASRQAERVVELIIEMHTKVNLLLKKKGLKNGSNL